MPQSDNFPQTFTDILRIIGRGRKLQRDLTRVEAAEAMRLLLNGYATDAQIGAFLITMRVKEETAEEIDGFLSALREAIYPLPRPSVDNLVDLGLPADGKARTLQTSVAAALVIASAGVPALLHGIDDVPTKFGVGPLNLLRALGYPADLPPPDVTARLNATNFGVLNLEHILPRWTDLTPIRSQFGLRTLMNTIEKLVNPLDAPIHISGFYHGNYLRRLAPVLPGARVNWIVQGEEGGVDIRPGKKTRVYRAEAGEMVETVINAADYGFATETPLIEPADPVRHASELRRALSGQIGPAYDQIALTAAVLLWMVEAAPDIDAGLERASRILDAGSALELLEAPAYLRIAD